MYRKISKTSPAQCYLSQNIIWTFEKTLIRSSDIARQLVFPNPYHISLTFYQNDNGKKEKGRQNVLYNHLLTKQNAGYQQPI